MNTNLVSKTLNGKSFASRLFHVDDGVCKVNILISRGFILMRESVSRRSKDKWFYMLAPESD